MKIIDKDIVYELEIDLFYVKIGALKEDGKPLKEMLEIYISRKITLLDL